MRVADARWVGWLLLIANLASSALAAPPVAAQDEFIPPEQAFKYTVAYDGARVTVRWNVTQGYYLYRKRLGIESEDAAATIGAVTFPKGETHSDEYFGEQEIYRGAFEISAPVSGTPAAQALALVLKLQGCADAGLCYPPLRWKTSVSTASGPSPIDSAFASRASATLPASSAPLTSSVPSNSGDFLPVDEAFRLDAVADGPDRVRIIWEIAPDYYLYRERLKVATDSNVVQLGALTLPKGETKTDEYFGTQEVYHDELIALLPVSRAAGAAVELPIRVTYQGCAEAGLCYPPETRTLRVTLPASTTASAGGASRSPAATGTGGFVSEQDRLALLIRDGNLGLVLATFFGIGLLLAFTPCVLPMVPILSGLIAGQGANVTTRRAFALSLAYVLGMALTNTLAGVAAAAAGQQVQAIFQQTWIIVLFGLLFVALALSMFGTFTIQMPSAIQSRLTDVSNKQRAGTYGGVAMMGALSALIVTACVAPAMIATLTVMSQSGDVVRGGSALFVMSLGMGAPLLILGASAGRWLPRAGAWMDTVKKLFGVLMLGVAAWMFARIVPERWALLLWAVPALAAAWLLWTEVKPASWRGWSLRAAGVLAALWGLALIAGAVLGGKDPLAPIPQLAARHTGLEFQRIKTLAELERAVATAAAGKRAVMLDFYADWCVSCKEMEKYTFTEPTVRGALRDVVLLQADVTANDAADQELLRHFGIFGPPTIAFYGPDGVERRNYRVVGFLKAEPFAAIAVQATAPTQQP